MKLIDKAILLRILDEMKHDEYIYGTNKTMKQLFKEVIEIIPYIEVEYKGFEESEDAKY